MTTQNLSGKVALIQGGSRGIGARPQMAKCMYVLYLLYTKRISP
jgi:hypothetical protein